MSQITGFPLCRNGQLGDDIEVRILYRTINFVRSTLSNLHAFSFEQFLQVEYFKCVRSIQIVLSPAFDRAKWKRQIW